jgi:A/G-specific adenine glycosylase
LGYPRRALRLHEAAGVIVKKFDNQVPRAIEDLQSLPGVGDYTAAAIAAFAYNESTLVLDVNIRRLFARVIDGNQFASLAPSKIERKLRYGLIPSDGAKWAAATMELGALICTARNPICDKCPVKQECLWRERGYPQSEVKRKSQGWSGTDRQCRGVIVQALRENKKQTKNALNKLWHDESQVDSALKTLLADGLIEATGKSYQLPN